MTNEQIIAEIAISLYGEEAVERMLEELGEIPLHTATVWQSRGFLIKKGEKGLETRLWKRRKRKDSDKKSDSDEEQEVPTNRNFYLCKSFLFNAGQVMKMNSQ